MNRMGKKKKKFLGVTFFTFITIIMVFGVRKKICLKKKKVVTQETDKNLSLFTVALQWIKVKQENRSISGYLKEKGYDKVAIYGMNSLGELLLNELSDSDIEVLYAIDRNADNLYSKIDIVNPTEDLQKVDAIIVTAITYFDEISNDLKNRMQCKILSLEDILYEV